MNESLKLAVMGFVVLLIFLVSIFTLKPLLSAVFVLIYPSLALNDYVWRCLKLNKQKYS